MPPASLFALRWGTNMKLFAAGSGRAVRFVLSFTSLLFAIPLLADAADDPLWERLKKGGLIVLMRNTAVDEGGGDPKGYKVDECATQLNLTDKGREQAKNIGKAFASRKIPITKVLTSRFCRCKETAELAFGKADVWDALNSFLDKPYAKSEQTRLLHERIGQPPGEGNLIIVTHGYNIASAVGLNPDPGDMMIIAPDSRVGYRVLGELSAKN
jgi:Histidine phosphatase superfamily (branch 1)